MVLERYKSGGKKYAVGSGGRRMKVTLPDSFVAMLMLSKGEIVTLEGYAGFQT